MKYQKINFIKYEQKLRSKLQIEDEIFDQITNKIRKTDTYKKCLEQYHNYLTKLAYFFKNTLNITDDVIISRMISDMIGNGFFADPLGVDSYDLVSMNRYILYEVPELLGMAISTGKSVCRHRAAFEVDLQNLVGNNTYYAPNHSFYKKKKDCYHLSNQCNHASALTISDTEISISDTTNEFQTNQIKIVQKKDTNQNYLCYESPSHKSIFFIPIETIYDYHIVKKRGSYCYMGESKKTEIEHIFHLVKSPLKNQSFKSKIELAEDILASKNGKTKY